MAKKNKLNTKVSILAKDKKKPAKKTIAVVEKKSPKKITILKSDRDYKFLTKEDFFAVCDLLKVSDISVLNACKEIGIKERTFYYYLSKAERENDTETLQYYTRAREIQARVIFTEIIKIADSIKVTGNKKDYALIDKAKIQIDARKFTIAKLLPKVYGDNKHIDITPSSSKSLAEILDGMDNVDEELKKRLAQNNEPEKN